MKIFLVVVFITMLVYVFSFEALLILYYSSKEDARKYKKSLKLNSSPLVKTIIFYIDAVGGHRLLAGYIGFVGILSTLIF